MSKNGNWFLGYLATNMGSVVLTTKKIVNFNCGAMRIKSILTEATFVGVERC